MTDLYGIMTGRGPGRDGHLPPPPYHVICQRYAWMGVVFEPESVAATLPPGVEGADEPRGFVAAYEASTGYALTPYTACYVAIEVKGHDASDGSPGLYMPVGWYSEPAHAILSHRHSASIVPGEGFVRGDGKTITAGGGPSSEPFVSFSFGLKEPLIEARSGVHNYVAPSPGGGGQTIWSVAFSGTRSLLGEPTGFKVNANAPEPIRRFQPKALLWAAEVPYLSVTFGDPASITERETQRSREAMLSALEVFHHVGKAAIVVDRDLRAIDVNEDAKAIFGDGLHVAEGRLVTRSRTDRQSLAAMVGRALDAGAADIVPAAIAIARESSDRPLFVQALPMRAGEIGPFAVLLLTDPNQKKRLDPAPALQLLGLTPAEARLAAQVGMGMAPKEAALRLDISEHTARSSLKVIYDKLSVGRQSELARIVTRLESLGP